jgi:hypothetical protein
VWRLRGVCARASARLSAGMGPTLLYPRGGWHSLVRSYHTFHRIHHYTFHRIHHHTFAITLRSLQKESFAVCGARLHAECGFICVRLAVATHISPPRFTHAQPRFAHFPTKVHTCPTKVRSVCIVWVVGRSHKWFVCILWRNFFVQFSRVVGSHKWFVRTRGSFAPCDLFVGVRGCFCLNACAGIIETQWRSRAGAAGRSTWATQPSASCPLWI